MTHYMAHYMTYEMLVRYIILDVCLRLRQFAQLSLMEYMDLCVFSLYISLVMNVNMRTLSDYQQIGGINNKLLFRVRSWNNGIRCMFCYTLIINCIEWSDQTVTHRISTYIPVNMTEMGLKWPNAFLPFSHTWPGYGLPLCLEGAIL